MYSIEELVKFRKLKKGSESTPCWIWTRHITNQGYGRIHVSPKEYKLVHILAYLATKGPYPKHLEIDHLCGNRPCFNPEHLEPVTHKENVRRGRVAYHLLTKKSCKHGHRYTESTTGYYFNQLTKNIRRYCKKCRKLQRAVAKLNEVAEI